MTDHHHSEPVSENVTLTFTRALADTLWHTGHKSFLADQRERFEDHPDQPDPDGEEFADGFLMWCRTAADAALLFAYEQAAGNRVTTLWDLDLEERVILSTRVYGSA